MSSKLHHNSLAVYIDSIAKLINPCNTLIIEDDLLIQKIHGQYLKTMGLKYDSAANGTDALMMMLKKKFEIILLDLELPDANGADLARLLRYIPCYKKSLVIVITSRTEPEIRKACLDVGVNAFFNKPVNFELLQNTIIEFFRRY